MTHPNQIVPRALVAGNWKMNGLRSSAVELKSLADKVSGSEDPNCDILVCPPATLIIPFSQQNISSAIEIGAQDCHTNEKGAHTGDLSAEIIKDAGATAVIVGHSERRTDHGESSELVREKAQAAYRAGLTAIICIGETQQQRDAGETLEIISTQLSASVPAEANASNTVIAYEPVWAIGTGLTPTEAQIGEVHTHIRQCLVQSMGDEAFSIRLLYGGSVKPDNAREILLIENVNGALVGGASLKADDFFGIISVYNT